MTGCLGPHLAALADGSISARRRERALAHVAACDRCRRALEAQRAVRACLSTASRPAPPGTLTDRLLHLPLEAAPLLPLGSLEQGRPASQRAATPPNPSPSRTSARRPSAPAAGRPSRSPSRAGRLVLVGGTASLVTVAGLTALASAPTAATSVPIGPARGGPVVGAVLPAGAGSTLAVPPGAYPVVEPVIAGVASFTSGAAATSAFASAPEHAAAPAVLLRSERPLRAMTSLR